MQCMFMLSPAAANINASADTFALYVAPNATLYINPGLQVGVLSNVINSGAFGTFKVATVNMLGDIWRNTRPALLFPTNRERMEVHLQV
jgi:hypothetical protein